MNQVDIFAGSNPVLVTDDVVGAQYKEPSVSVLAQMVERCFAPSHWFESGTHCKIK